MSRTGLGYRLLARALLTTFLLAGCTEGAPTDEPAGDQVTDETPEGAFTPAGSHVRVGELVLQAPEGAEVRREDSAASTLVYLLSPRNLILIVTGPEPDHDRFLGCPRPPPEPQTDEAPVITCREVALFDATWTRITTREALEYRAIHEGQLYRLIGAEGDEPTFRTARFD